MASLGLKKNRMSTREDNNVGISVTKRTRFSPIIYEDFGQLDTPGKRLRYARMKKEMTIRDVAEKARLTENTVGKLEKEKHMAILPTLRKLAAVLDVPISYLGCFENLPGNTKAEKITKARFYHGLTKQEFAQKLGTNVKTLRQWERGKCHPNKHFQQKLEPYFSILRD